MSGNVVESAVETAAVALAEIRVGARLRPVDGSAVEALMASIEANGLIQAVQLRRDGAGALWLIAGAHRLEAHRRLGRATIRADIRDCGEDRARLIEIEENLVEAELSVLDLAVHLAEQRRLYQALYPEARQGAAGAVGLHKNYATDTMSVA